MTILEEMFEKVFLKSIDFDNFRFGENFLGPYIEVPAWYSSLKNETSYFVYEKDSTMYVISGSSMHWKSTIGLRDCKFYAFHDLLNEKQIIINKETEESFISINNGVSFSWGDWGLSMSYISKKEQKEQKVVIQTWSELKKVLGIKKQLS